MFWTLNIKVICDQTIYYYYFTDGTWRVYIISVVILYNRETKSLTDHVGIRGLYTYYNSRVIIKIHYGVGIHDIFVILVAYCVRYAVSGL